MVWQKALTLSPSQTSQPLLAQMMTTGGYQIDTATGTPYVLHIEDEVVDCIAGDGTKLPKINGQARFSITLPPYVEGVRTFTVAHFKSK